TTKLIARIASLGKRAGPASGPNLSNIVFATSAALWIAARNEDVCSWFTSWLASQDQNKTRHRTAARILPCSGKANGSSESTCGHPWRDKRGLWPRAPQHRDVPAAEASDVLCWENQGRMSALPWGTTKVPVTGEIQMP